MPEKTFKDMQREEFLRLLDNIGKDEVTDLTDTTFFKALAEIDAAGPQEEFLLTGRVVDGQLVLNETAPLPVSGNEIRVGNSRIIINLEPAEVG